MFDYTGEKTLKKSLRFPILKFFLKSYFKTIWHLKTLQKNKLLLIKKI